MMTFAERRAYNVLDMSPLTPSNGAVPASMDAVDPSSAGAGPATVIVRIFGSLRPLRTARGLPSTLTVQVPQGGIAARDLAGSLGLPPDKLEGVFVNHGLHGIGVHVSPGDRVAFVPYGTPGPHRVLLGLYAAGKTKEAATEGGGDTSG